LGEQRALGAGNRRSAVGDHLLHRHNDCGLSGAARPPIIGLGIRMSTESRLASVAKFRALPPAERRFALTSAFLLPIVAAAVRVLGFARVLKWLACEPAKTRRFEADAPALAALVNAAANHLPVACTCLTRSLLLDWRLRRRGFASELRIGVRRVHDGLEAHAWVQLNGMPLNDTARAVEMFAAFEGPVSPRLLPRV
jgi:hypothetical protein